MIDDIKPFPIQGADFYKDEKGKGYFTKVSKIPWWLAEVAYKEYTDRYCNGQSLERLAERGGFGRQELVDLIRGKIK